MSTSQLSSERQLAAIQIRRASTDNRPDSFYPKIVPDLKLVAAFGENGHWDLHLEDPTGDKITNAMITSDVCPGAMVYHGTKEGINKASLTAMFLANTQYVSMIALTQTQCFETGLHPTNRTANLRLRVADAHQYAQPRKGKPSCPCESSGQLAVFLLPWREELNEAACSYETEKKALILEEVNGGTNAWSFQLAHVKAAQMNGVGQHVFFGPLEFL